MIIDGTIIVCGAIAIALAPNAICLYFGEFLVGYILGTQKASIIPYTSEICEPQIRKYTEIMYTLYSAVGNSLAFLLGIFLSYRIILYLIAGVGVIHVFLLYFCPQSPRWLITKGRILESKSEMKRLRRNGVVAEAEIQNIKRAVENANVKRLNSLEGNNENGVNWFRRTWLVFNQQTFYRPFLVLLVLFPVGRILTGGPSMRFYMIQILNHSKLPMTSHEAAAILAIYQVLITLFCCISATFFPRRPLLLYSSCLIAIGCLGFGTVLYFDESKYYQNYMESHEFTRWSPIVALALIFTGQNGGFKLATNIYMGLLLPSKTRSLGLSSINFVTTVLLCVEITLTPYLIEILGTYGLFWFFATITTGVLIFSYFCVPEVFGRSLEEIENHYREKSGVNPLLLKDSRDIMTSIIMMSSIRSKDT